MDIFYHGYAHSFEYHYNCSPSRVVSAADVGLGSIGEPNLGCSNGRTG